MGKKTIVAVGGGEIGRVKTLPDGTTCQTEIETTIIDRFIVEATGKPNPKMLFIGTASHDKPSYFEVVEKHFKGRLGCASVVPLNLVETEISFEEIKNKIFSNDIIYVGGGDTTTMLKIWRARGVDKFLYEAYQKGIVLAGISAGAVCWFEYYDNMDDIDSIEKLEIVSGLAFVKGFAVPHYNQLSEGERSKINQKLAEKELQGWAIDDCVAVVLEDADLRIISCRQDCGATQVP